MVLTVCFNISTCRGLATWHMQEAGRHMRGVAGTNPMSNGTQLWMVNTITADMKSEW